MSTTPAPSKIDALPVAGELLLKALDEAISHGAMGSLTVVTAMHQLRAALAPTTPVPAEPAAEVVMSAAPAGVSPAWKPHKIVHASFAWLDSVPVGTKLYATPPQQLTPAFMPVGEVLHLNELNDLWLEKLPVGTKLYTTPAQQTQSGAVAGAVDPLAEECMRLQNALAFWMPSVPSMDHPLHARIATDAYLLAGYDGPDTEPSAYEQGLLKFAAPISQLIESWEERSRKAFPTDSMLINKHIRELHAALKEAP